MYKALIVEDEELELLSLKKILTQAYPDILLLETADNGDTAIRLITEFVPDIVLLDIHLGNYNGLDLAKDILKDNPSARVVIITAYDFFQYARQAVSLGVADYLLKPVSTHGLTGTIDRQLDYLENLQKKLLADAQRENNFNRMKEVFVSSFVSSIMNNLIPGGAADTLDLLKIPRTNMCIFAISCQLSSTSLGSNGQMLAKNLIAHTITSRFPDITILYDITTSDYITLCVLYPESYDSDNIRMAELIRTTTLAKHGIRTKIGVSRSVHDVMQLGHSYKESILALTIGDDLINQYTDFLKEMPSPFDFDNLVTSLIPSVMKGSWEESNTLLTDFYTSFSTQDQPLSYQKTCFITLWINFVKELGACVVSKDVMYHNTVSYATLDLLHAGSESDLQTVLTHNIHNMYEYVRNLLDDNVNYITRRAKDMINADYAQPLTLNTIASRLNISPYYLSHIFKDTFGINVIEYLNTVRIENGRKLLAQTELSIGEVALKTGFAEANYFCRVFKKITHTTPSEYKKMSLPQRNSDSLSTDKKPQTTAL